MTMTIMVITTTTIMNSVTSPLRLPRLTAGVGTSPASGGGKHSVFAILSSPARGGGAAEGGGGGT
jgi:hypothetical protein